MVSGVQRQLVTILSEYYADLKASLLDVCLGSEADGSNFTASLPQTERRLTEQFYVLRSCDGN
jgi:hypothetical protein